MNTKKLIEQLRKTASTLAPLTNIKPPITGDLAQGNWKQPEPYAFAWRSKLDTIANMIEYQLCALSPNQMSISWDLVSRDGKLARPYLRSHGARS
jgi:hypothetical protein